MSTHFSRFGRGLLVLGLVLALVSVVIFGAFLFVGLVFTTLLPFVPVKWLIYGSFAIFIGILAYDMGKQLDR
jgi:hypothetical protein